MRKKITALCLALCLLLCGCTGWMDGSYSSVNPHTDRSPQTDDQTISVSGYLQLRNALVKLAENGTESALINVAQMDQDAVEADMDRAVAYVTGSSPVGAFAVEAITYEMGTSGGQPALAVSVTYNSNRAELRRIKQADNMEQVRQIIADALEQCESGVVLRVNQFRETDLVQFVQDYANENPNLVMELPQVTVSMFPEFGTDRVIELIFTYQNSRESLRSMQSRVRSLFTSAELYVSGNASDHEKYAQLYAFLMERNEYTVETSITPAYSLLIHGVGDSRAFAVVYAAMCRRADLECLVVSGTWEGQPLFWNIVCDEGVYYHVDLLRCSRDGYFRELLDEDMSGYVWDYSAYPQCVVPEPEPTGKTTEPGTEPTE